MVFLQTNAVDLNALLIALKNFLSANGWTVLADGTGGGGLTLEMTNANGHDFKFTSRVDAQVAFWTGVGVAFNDRLLQIAFQKSDIGMAAGYTTAPAETNDMSGPFSNVWLVTDAAATYCHCVLQTGNARYNHFSFGDLDNKGLHATVLPYAMGLYYFYWPNGANYINGNLPMNNPGHGAHNIGMYCDDMVSEVLVGTGRSMRVGVPDGVVDPTLGFTDGPIEAPILRGLSSRWIRLDASGDLAGAFLDFIHQYDNQGYTGGVPIFPIPLIQRAPANGAHTQLGVVPTFGQVNMDGLSPSQQLDFAGEQWLCFPIKQKGTYEGLNGGTNPQNMTNSLNLGLAIRKA
jgi:hypothetical protein